MFQEMSATIIVSWSFVYNGLYKIIQGYLCSVYFYEGKPVYFALHRPEQTPAYPLDQIIDILYDLSMEAGLSFLQIKFIADSFIADYQNLSGYTIKIESFEADSEYVYRTADLANLLGRDNYKKRSRIKKFLAREDDITLIPITRENIHICLEIEHRWCRDKDCTYCASFSGCEKKAMEIMADIFDEQIYYGLIGFYEGAASGYVICEKRDPQLSCMYFGKATVSDFFMYLIYKLATGYLADCTYMNMNEDMGNLGLRSFKRELSAYELWRKNSCILHRIEKQDPAKGCRQREGQ
ncbi:MAG: phosphatidylglycerol lysyltransferase domain-containing protein [Spirochaetaceae bacterium]|nr:phosphatidylglycerol lysyltransferase domain-containing protein [Spirochaetaceae bacterium]